MEEGENQLRKKGRIKKQLKKKISKTSGTLAGQVARTKTAKGYKKDRDKKVKVKF